MVKCATTRARAFPHWLLAKSPVPQHRLLTIMNSFITDAEVEHGDFPWCHVEWMSNPALTDAKHLLLVRAEFASGQQHNFHLHPHRDEIIYVLEGEATQWVGAKMKVLGPGDMAHIPAGTAHATRNAGPAPLKFLAILSPVEAEGNFTTDVYNEEPWCSLLAPVAY